MIHQYIQIVNIYISEWLVLIWLFKLEVCMNVFPHFEHRYGLSPEWSLYIWLSINYINSFLVTKWSVTHLMCTLSVFCCPNLSPQPAALHMWGLSYVWVLLCSSKPLLFASILSQYSHINCWSLIWVFIWTFKSYCKPKLAVHLLQKYWLFLLWSLWMWSFKWLGALKFFIQCSHEKTLFSLWT